MTITDVLLVTRNYQGLCEENFLSTPDEFIKEYCPSHSNGWTDAEGLERIVHAAKPFEWSTTFYARGNDSYDMRICQGPEDLLNFLSGKFNSDIEEMENNNPGMAGQYDDWYWENREDKCSPLAIESVSLYAHESSRRRQAFKDDLLSVMPDFPLIKASELGVAAKLEDVIKNAEKNGAFNRRASVPESSLEL